MEQFGDAQRGEKMTAHARQVSPPGQAISPRRGAGQDEGFVERGEKVEMVKQGHGVFISALFLQPLQQIKVFSVRRGMRGGQAEMLHAQEETLFCFGSGQDG